MELFNSIFYFLIVIGILILIHEFGHFIAARLSGMRTEVFSFGWGYRLFGFNKKNGFTFGPLPNLETGTEDSFDNYCDYRLSLFPIGGYVKISGMVDESFDVNFTSSKPQPWEFRSKNAFKKIIVLSAGVIMNALLAFFIFTFVILGKGENITSTTVIGYVQEGSLAAKIGLKAGDKILSVDGEKIENWQELDDMLFPTISSIFGSSKSIEYESEGKTTSITIKGKSLINSIFTRSTRTAIPIGLVPEKTKAYLTSVLSFHPADKAGLKQGDTIQALNGEKICSFNQFIDILHKQKGKTILFEWKHAQEMKADSIKPDNDGLVGVGLAEDYYGTQYHKSYNILESSFIGYKRTTKAISIFVISIFQIFEGQISVKQSFGGPIAIAISSKETAKLGIINFLQFIALLSISLAVINILPVPALDGGHLVFIIIEAIIRREVSVKIKMNFQKVGFALLLLLMAFIIYNDVVKYVIK
jgi:regulator of sigma E protease